MFLSLLLPFILTSGKPCGDPSEAVVITSMSPQHYSTGKSTPTFSLGVSSNSKTPQYIDQVKFEIVDLGDFAYNATFGPFPVTTPVNLPAGGTATVQATGELDLPWPAGAYDAGYWVLGKGVHLGCNAQDVDLKEGAGIVVVTGAVWVVCGLG